MRNPFPKKKSRLPPLGKALAAVHVVQEVLAERMDDKQVSSYLRQKVGLQWTLLTAFQYLTGQEAIGALSRLPQDWVGEGGMTRAQVLESVTAAHQMCANCHPSGRDLSAGLLVQAFKRNREAVNASAALWDGETSVQS